MAMKNNRRIRRAKRIRIRAAERRQIEATGASPWFTRNLVDKPQRGDRFLRVFRPSGAIRQNDV